MYSLCRDRVVGPRPQPPLSAHHGGPQPRPPHPNTPWHPFSHSRRKMCRRCRSTSAAASIFSSSRSRRGPSRSMTGSTGLAPPRSRSGALCCTRSSVTMPTHAHDNRRRQERLYKIVHVASCAAVTGVPTTVSGIHSMRETRRGLVARLVCVALMQTATRATQMSPIRRCMLTIRRVGDPRCEVKNQRPPFRMLSIFDPCARTARATRGGMWAGRRHRLTAPARPWRARASGRTGPTPRFFEVKNETAKRYIYARDSHTR